MQKIITLAMFGRAALAIAFCLTAAGSAAQSKVPPDTEPKASLAAGETGKIYFKSAQHDVTYIQLYKHTADFNSPIWGELRFPANMTSNKVPAMVLMHSSGGIDSRVYDWSDFFNKMGIATFVVDSFTPRGILQTVTDQSQLNEAATSADGLLALKLLATHSRIDANRIGVIGWSKGGYGAMTDSFEKLRAAVVQSDVKYALHIPFYGGCNQYAKTTSAPILLLAGTEDQFFKIVDCRKNVETLKRLGANLKFVEYEGALHGFDTTRQSSYSPRAQTAVKCTRAVDLDTLEVHILGAEQAATPEEAKSYFKSCMSFGVKTGGDPGAATKAQAEVKEFVTKNFGLVGQ